MDLRAVEDVEPPALAHRRLADLPQLCEHVVQLRGRDARRVAVEELGDGVEQPLEPAPRVRRDGDERRPLAQAAPQPLAHVLEAHGRLVPLGQDDERRAVGLARDVGDGEILLDDSLRRVDEDERDVGPLRGFERAQLRVVLDALAMLALAAQPRGVDEHERSVTALEHGVDRVARRPGDLGDDHALAAEQCVYEARLADVRAAEDRDADRFRRELLTRRSSVRLEVADDLVEQVAGAVAVERRDRDRIAEPELVQLECERVVLRVVDLVREHEHRLVRLAQDLRDLLVAGSDPELRVDDEEHEVRLGDGLARLHRDRARDRRLVGDVDAAGVDEQEPPARPLAHELLAVARDAGGLVHDRSARARQPVDERRLAHVGEADDGDGTEEAGV